MFDIFSASDGKKAANAGAAAQSKAAQAARTGALGYMDKGVAAATPQYEKAIDLYNQWSNTGRSANQMYGNALGLNGADGNAAAVSAFQAGPGYEFAVESGLDAVDRRAASRGMLGSGNTNLDSIRFSQGLANQEYGNWLNNLNTASNAGLNATNSQANQISGYGDFLYGDNAARASLEHGTQTALGQIEAQRQADIAAAKQQASGNIWGAIMGVGDLAARFYGASKTPTKTV